MLIPIDCFKGVFGKNASDTVSIIDIFYIGLSDLEAINIDLFHIPHNNIDDLLVGMTMLFYLEIKNNDDYYYSHYCYKCI